MNNFEFRKKLKIFLILEILFLYILHLLKPKG